MTQPSDRPEPTVPPAIWGELQDICQKLHRMLYLNGNPEGASKFVPSLERLIRFLPAESSAIDHAQAQALLAEIKGKHDEAIGHRTREIELAEELHRLVGEGVDHPRILVGRDSEYIRQRIEIIQSLANRSGGG